MPGVDEFGLSLYAGSRRSGSNAMRRQSQRQTQKHTRPARAALGIAAMLAITSVPPALIGCASRSSPSPHATDAPASDTSRESTVDIAPQPERLTISNPDPTGDSSSDIVQSIEPWAFNTKPGVMLRTQHYRVFTTEREGVMIQRLPSFIEAALANYRVALTGPDRPLPEPELRMDTFIMSTRPDWEILAKQLLGDQAAPYLKIRRGGFAYSGRALLFDVGTRDTLSLISHEGWHQYTQRTFRQALPAWLEEGIATYMEGHRFGGPGGGELTFQPWSNVERFDQLRRAAALNRLMPLRELLSASPGALIGAGGTNDSGLVFYAQVWALTHFLAEGEGGKYRPRLEALLRDAAAGNITRSVQRALGANAGSGVSRGTVISMGPPVFMAYFDQDLDAADKAFRAFQDRLVQPGSRGSIVAGLSPIPKSSTEPARAN